MLNSTLETRKTWSEPKLEELGNLRTLVMVGQGRGKSSTQMDGSGSAGCEGKDGQMGCPIP